MLKENEKAWMQAYTKGSKDLQARLAKIHAANPEFQNFVKKHGFGGTLSKKQAEKQKKSSVVTVPPANKGKPEMRGTPDREAMIKAAAEKLRSRRAAASNRVAFGGELGGGFIMPHSSFRTYREHLEEQKKKLDKLGFPMMKNAPALPPPKEPHPVPQGYERVKDSMGFNVLRKIRKEDVAYLDGFVATSRGGWVARRNGKQIGPVVPTKEIAQKYIKNTKKGIAAKILNALSSMKPKMATESKENRERVRSYDSAVVVSKVGKLPKLTVDPKSRLKKLFNRIGPVGVKKLMALENTEMSSKESLNELRKSTLASYIQKASNKAAITRGLGKEFQRDSDASHAAADKIAAKHNTDLDADAAERVFKRRLAGDAEQHLATSFMNTSHKRLKGVSMAASKLAKEEVEEINERNTESHPKLWDTHALVHKSGKVLEKGAKVKGFRGTYKIHGFELPHHSGSTGRVYTDKGSFFPGVVDAKIVKRVSHVSEETEQVNEVSRGVIAKLATARYNQAQLALKDKNYPEYVKKMQKAMKAGDATTPNVGWTPEDDPKNDGRVKKEEVINELSNKTLASYAVKAQADSEKKMPELEKLGDRAERGDKKAEKAGNKLYDKISKRQQGIKSAIVRITNPDLFKKEELKVGDKVRLKKDWAGSDERNKIFTVQHRNADGDYWIGQGKSKSGWYVGDHQVAKVKFKEDTEELIAKKAALAYQTKIGKKKKKRTLKTMKEEMISEISNSTLASYVTKAIADRKATGRGEGVKKAVAKVNANLPHWWNKMKNSSGPSEPLAAHTEGEKSRHGGWFGMEARESEYRANQQLSDTTPRRQPGHYLTRDGRTLSGPHSPSDAVRKYKDMSDSRNVKIVHVKEAKESGEKAKKAVALALKGKKKGQTANVEPELNMPHHQTSQPMLQGSEGVPQNVRI